MNAMAFGRGWYGTAWFSMEQSAVHSAWRWVARRIASAADGLVARGGSGESGVDGDDSLRWKYPVF
ncbi:MAG TPA: hypothetical protein VGG99_22925 [Acetobacteraceae bacterium]|jgi:hypothetical protein